MSYFTAQQHASIAADPSVIATLYASERTRFLASLGSNFAAEPEEHFKLAFCAVFAYDHVPYGPDGGSVADPLVTLLSRPNMDCDNYVAVTWRLFELLDPGHATKVAALGWDGGYFGNHAQICAHKTPNGGGSGGGSLLCDPTIGLVVCAHNYDWYAAGKNVNSAYSASFYYDKGDGIGQFDSTVKTALFTGKIKPSDILYTFSDVNKFASPPPMADWPTPALVDLKV